MGLNEQQWEFSRMLADLIEEAHHQGYQVVVGEVYRPPVTAAYYATIGKGITNSFHTKKLAADLLLFRGGKYLEKTEDYRPLGIYWESRGGTWGGRFKRADGNHFSLGE